ncbi:hypothetical protein BC833DRAFT_609859 [Globomyces pollinis-pini]|nr:hypothetical protein BC833DRAFT_609859 [Globomyces pollinis-pini]
MNAPKKIKPMETKEEKRHKRSLKIYYQTSLWIFLLSFCLTPFLSLCFVCCYSHHHRRMGILTGSFLAMLCFCLIFILITFFYDPNDKCKDYNDYYDEEFYGYNEYCRSAYTNLQYSLYYFGFLFGFLGFCGLIITYRISRKHERISTEISQLKYYHYLRSQGYDIPEHMNGPQFVYRDSSLDTLAIELDMPILSQLKGTGLRVGEVYQMDLQDALATGLTEDQFVTLKRYVTNKSI